MEKINANNYENAFKELAAEDKKAAQALSETINKKDGNYYHSILLRFTVVPGSRKNDMHMSIVKNHKNAFDRLSKNVGVAQADKMILLHDPSVMKEQPKSIAPAHHVTAAKEVVSAEQAAANAKEFDAKVNAEVEKRMAAAEQAATGATADDASKPGADNANDEVVVTEKNTVPELKAFAAVKGIDLTGLELKADIFGAISAFLEDN